MDDLTYKNRINQDTQCVPVQLLEVTTCLATAITKNHYSNFKPFTSYILHIWYLTIITRLRQTLQWALHFIVSSQGSHLLDCIALVQAIKKSPVNNFSSYFVAMHNLLHSLSVMRLGLKFLPCKNSTVHPWRNQIHIALQKWQQPTRNVFKHIKSKVKQSVNYAVYSCNCLKQPPPM